jgi:VanZ family protein
MGRRVLSLWGPVIGWMGLIFFASSRSDTGAIGRIPDWLTHGATYFVLGLLLLRALGGGLDRRLSPGAGLLALGLGAAYGASDEWHQSFVPGRDASVWDVAKDVAGCCVALAVHGLGMLPARSHR